MSHRVAYYRVSTLDQSVEAQREALGGNFDEEFTDEGISGTTPAADRPDFAALLKHVRKGDSVHVYAIDRLGRDALDVQATVKALLDRGVTVDVSGLGPIAGDAGKIIVAVLAQMAEIERNRIRERCEAGRTVARAHLVVTGLTHRGKASLGRPSKADRAEVVAWRKANGASIKATADHFDISPTTVKRHCAA
ncbi:putative DNA-invertase from lambdoid prophage Rac [Sphingomonas laterariae]|uniref:Putative DNA-invertase from lambdoid prophage Rac n=1 Tax=Edaphosphingomonas laterariae TaxID=861865 RepID=A0A239EUB2_9SPHN|nr:recombinase family protein [Sphingomonas laterariae]SNS48360.1 putative DNA-invertase from lambdoid prophage Rac [Sphingomonas laterariae]